MDMNKPLREQSPFIPFPYIDKYPKDEHGDIYPSTHKYDYDYEDPKKFVYRPKNFAFKFKRFFIRTFAFLIGEPIVRFRYGIKIVGKKNYRLHKKEMKEGFITVCNHVLPWDCLAVSATRMGRFPEFPMWQAGFESTIGPLLRSYGGFPVVKTVHGVMNAYIAMRAVIKEHKWLHVYPEAACWNNYAPLREFKDGTFRLAYELGTPVFPLVISYRPRHGFFKLYCRKDPLVTLKIGEPQYALKTLSRADGTKELLNRVHLKMIQMAGLVNEKENEELKKLYSYQ